MRVLVGVDAPSRRGAPRRTVAVGAIVFAVVAALLGVGFAWGWRGVRARQHELRGEPAAIAAGKAGELTRDLRGRLEALIARETGRAYGEYRNEWLPTDPFVLGYFQIDVHGDVTTPEPTNLAEHRAFRDEVERALVRPLHEDANETAAIVVGPLVWQTVSFAGAPALVAVRRVDTPDGALAQGFVIDRAALTSELAAHADDLVAELHTDGAGAEIAPRWTLTVAPNPHAVARAFDEARAVARGFMIRFVAIALAAVLAGAFVVLLVARERGRLAAALADDEAARLGRVVSNVLGVPRLVHGTVGVDAQVGPIGEALRELAERAEAALGRAGAALAVDVAPDLRARFDRDALARVVANLLDHAEKFARGSDDRTIALAARDRGDRIEIEVSDRGPDVTDTRADLPLSRSLARAMGGELEHRAGRFVLTLPRA